MDISIEVSNAAGTLIDITPVVEFATASFTAQANGVAGQASLRIKDPASDPLVTTRFPDVGARLLLTIDGVVEWRGYVTRRSYQYAFDVEDTTEVRRPVRFILLEGVDLNILFSRRYVYDQADPRLRVPFYAKGTEDTAVIEDIIGNYVSDVAMVDWSSGVQNVGTPGQFEEFKIAAVGDSLGTVLNRVTLNLGSVFYIDPDAVFRYVDTETVTAPYDLSDDPTGEGQVGYRRMTIRSIGDELCNDIFVRGTGAGSPDMVVSRYEDQESIDKRGRFQVAELHSEMFKQGTADIRAETYVIGSPQNKRGHRNEKDIITCTVFVQGFRVSQLVSFESVVHGYQDAVPIRTSRITFPTPTAAMWELGMGHEIDPGIVFADWPEPPGTTREHLPWGENVECGGCADVLLEAGIRDEFNRSVMRPGGQYAMDDGFGVNRMNYNWFLYGPSEGVPYESEWGTSDSGHTWINRPDADPRPMQGIYNSSGVVTDQATSGIAWVWANRNVNLGFEEVREWVIHWRFFGRIWTFRDHLSTLGSTTELEPRFLPLGQEAFTVPIVASSETAGSIGDLPGTWYDVQPSNEWRTTRVRLQDFGFAQAPRFHAKTWIDGQGEPSGWDVDEEWVREANYPTGFFAIGWDCEQQATGDGTQASEQMPGGLACELQLDYVREVDYGTDGSGSCHEAEIAFGPVMEPDTYRLWDQWETWVNVNPDPEGEPTWASGEYVFHDAPVDPLGRWREIWSNDTVIGGSAYPDPVEPAEYLAHAAFVEYEYAEGYDPDNPPAATGGAGCAYATTYPFVAGSLKASYNGEPLTVVESGNGHNFLVSPDPGGTIQVTYRRSDAYENGPEDQDLFPDIPDVDHNPDGDDGTGEWRWPCHGRISQDYGCTSFGSVLGYEYGIGCPSSAPYFHDGWDIVNAPWHPLRAPAAGRVTVVGWNPWDTSDPAFLVVVVTDDGYQWSLSHMKPRYVVSVGQRVAKGQVVGYMGDTGNTTGTHTHFEGRLPNGSIFDVASKCGGRPPEGSYV